MVKKSRKGRPPTVRPPGPLFLTEWMEEQGVTDIDLAKAMNVSPTTTVWRWKQYPSRLDPIKQAKIAKVLRIWPGQLWMHPKAKKMRMIKIVLEDDTISAFGDPTDNS